MPILFRSFERSETLVLIPITDDCWDDEKTEHSKRTIVEVEDDEE